MQNNNSEPQGIPTLESPARNPFMRCPVPNLSPASVDSLRQDERSGIPQQRTMPLPSLDAGQIPKVNSKVITTETQRIQVVTAPSSSNTSGGTPNAPSVLLRPSTSQKVQQPGSTELEIIGLLKVNGAYVGPYLHTQNSALSTWVIVHNLNKYPSVTIFDSTGREVKGQIQYDSLSQVTLSFNAPFSGEASLM